MRLGKPGKHKPDQNTPPRCPHCGAAAGAYRPEAVYCRWMGGTEREAVDRVGVLVSVRQSVMCERDTLRIEVAGLRTALAESGRALTASERLVADRLPGLPPRSEAVAPARPRWAERLTSWLRWIMGADL